MKPTSTNPSLAFSGGCSRPLRSRLRRFSWINTLALLGAASSHVASAADIRVPTDSTLSSAISSASSGDTIIFDSSITLSGSTSIGASKQNLTFTAADPLSPVTITAGSGARVFSVTQGSSYTFDNLIFQGVGAQTSSATAISISATNAIGTTTTLAGTFTVTGFTTTNGQGAIYSNGAGSTILLGGDNETVTFTNNTASGRGAAVNGINVVFDGAAVFRENVSTGNNGGAISVTENLTFQGTTILENNQTKGLNANGTYGGAIYANTAGYTVSFLGDAVLSGNSTAHGNGGAMRANGNVLFDQNLTLANNSANRDDAVNATLSVSGGGFLVGQDLTINGAVTATNNSAVTHGGAFSVTGSATLGSGASFTENIAMTGNGGAINVNGNASLGSSAFTGNSAGGGGGAIYAQSNLTIGSGSIFTNNTAGGNGGAIYLSTASAATASTTLKLDASSGDIVFRGNTANGAANAIYLSQGLSTDASHTITQTLDLVTGAGKTIAFYDPVVSKSNDSDNPLAIVNKTGAGTVLFDGGTDPSNPHKSNLYATTVVSEGTLQVASGAIYGASPTAGSLTLKAGASLAGSGTIQANDLTLEAGSTLRAADAGTLTLLATNRTIDTTTGLHLAGNGSIEAGAPLTAASISVDHAATLTLKDATTLRAGGTLGTSGSGGTLNTDAPLTLAGAATVTAAAGQDVTIAAALEGASGALTKTGAGSAILSGANTYAGGTTISEGNLTATTVAALGSGPVVNNASLTIDLAADDTLAGGVAGSGGLTKTGAATLTLSGANTYSGRTTINQGTLMVGSASAVSGLATSAGVALGDGTGAVFDLNGYDVSVASLSGAGEVALGTADLTVNAAAGTSSTYAGTLSGGSGGSLTKTGAGTLALSGAQPAVAGFAADVLVSGGALNVNGGTLTTTGHFAVEAGATLGLSAGTASIEAAQVVFADSSIINIVGYSATNLGAIDLVSSSSAITANLSQLGLHFDGVAVASSIDQYLTLRLETAASNTKLQLISDLAWRATTDAHGTFNIASGAVFTPPVALADNTTFTSTLAGWDGKSLTKTGNGTLVLGQVNSYTGATKIEAGTLQLDVADAIAQSSAVTVSSGATLDLNGNNQTLHQISGEGSIQLGAAALTADEATDAVLSGAIAGDTGRLIKIGAGALTLSGSNTYTGGTTISAGKLIATHTGALGTGNVANHATLEFNVAADGTYAGTIAGSGNLTKTGAGTLTLSAATGSAGNLAVEAGNLTLGDGTVAQSFTAGAATVGANAALTVQKDSTLAIADTFALADNSTLNLVVGSTAPIVSANTATIGTTGTKLNVSGVTGSTSMPFTLVSTSGGITGDFADISVGGSGGSSTDYIVISAFKDGNNYVVNTQLLWDSAAGGANGTFTLTDASESFEVGTVLANRAANSAGWDGTSLTKAGAGTLVLSATNTYTGTTSVNAGTLRFGTANAIAQSSEVNVAGGATLDLNNHHQTLNNLSGAGSISLGSASLTTSGTANTTLSGVISGTGRVVKQGTGTLTLSGVNTYTGGTTISAGTLLATNVSALGTGNVTNNGTLEFALSGTNTYASVISGNGALAKSGAGTLVFTGNSSGFGGSTTVRAGALTVNGSLGGTLTIASGARLQGIGTVGTTTIASGGVLSPGNSIGTLNVSGNLTFASGSIYQVELDATGASDRTVVSGTATIQSDATVSVTKAAGDYSYGTRYTILTASGGVTGSFANLTQEQPFIDLLFGQDANNVYLDVKRNTIAFEEYAQTPNQRAAARAVESLGAENTLYRIVTGLPDAETVQAGFDQLSGDIHASLQGALIDDARALRVVSLERGRSFAQAPASDRGIVRWAQVVTGEATTDDDGNAASVRRNTYGVLTGLDGGWSDTVRIGLLLGYTKGSLDVADHSASADLDSFHLGTYGNYKYGHFTVRGGASYTRHDINTRRAFSVPDYRETLAANREAVVIQGFGEAGYFIPFKNGGLEPFAAASLVYLETDAFKETGGTAALTGRSEKRDNPTGTLGTRAVYELDSSPWKVRLIGSLGWQHSFESLSTRQRLAFVGGGEAFRVSGVPLSRDMVAVEGGVGINVTPNTRIDLSYSGRLSSETKDHGAHGVVTIAF
ncbi:MAG TPA: autotransporter domain-containing protein [Opitutaceae bacterium]